MCIPSHFYQILSHLTKISLGYYSVKNESIDLNQLVRLEEVPDNLPM